jgi:Leucine-rich repeat (LRR) protein
MGRLLGVVVMIGLAAALLGAVVGALVVATAVPLGGEGAWLIWLSAVLTGSVAAVTTMVAARLRRQGGDLRAGLASVLGGGCAGALVAQQAFATSPRGKQLLLFAVGSLVGGGAFALVRRLRATSSPAVREPRDRWFQFTLGSLLAFTLIASVALAIWVRGPIKRRQTLAVIERGGGGRVRYASRAPEWICDLLGDTVRGVFDEVEEIDLNRATDADVARIAIFEHLRSVSLSGDFTDEAMNALARCRSLEQLSLSSPSISNQGLAKLASLPRLRHLSLPAPADDDILRAIGTLRQLEQLDMLGRRTGSRGLTTAAGWPQLGKLKNLQELALHSIAVDDQDLAFLEQLTRLRRLNLSLTKFSDAGVAHLQPLKELESLTIIESNAPTFRGTGLAELSSLGQLRHLDLRSTAVTDKGLRAIAALSNLEALNLASDRITDSGLRHLSQLTRLRWLTLSGISVSEVGLRHLESLPRLETVYYDNTKITAAGIARLENALRKRRSRNRPGE